MAQSPQTRTVSKKGQPPMRMQSMSGPNRQVREMCSPQQFREVALYRQRTEVDAGADTKTTTTKMWKRKNKGKKRHVAITRLRGPRGWGLSHGLDPPPTPNLGGGTSKHQMPGSKCLHGKGCQKRVVRAFLNFWLRPVVPAVLSCGFPSGIIR